MGDASIDGNLIVTGTIRPGGVQYPVGDIEDEHIATYADISVSKMQHQHIYQSDQADGSAVVDATTLVHIARGAGSITAIKAVLKTACIGDSTITVDVRRVRTGVAHTVLSAVIDFDSGDAAWTVKTGSIDGDYDDLIADDVIMVIVDATVGTGTLGQGLCADIVCTQDA